MIYYSQYDSLYDLGLYNSLYDLGHIIKVSKYKLSQQNKSALNAPPVALILPVSH